MARQLPRLYRRMPTAFGPFPGPRQTFDGFRRNGANIHSTEAFMTFTTRQDDIASLLPPCFAFQNPGPTAYVTVAPKRLDNLDWLAGRGYSLLSVYIHGVQVMDQRQKRLCRGTYLPVLWENLADPIISGREELGYPKLFADLDFQEETDRQQSSCTARAHWQGSMFADFQLRGLHAPDDSSGPPGGSAPAEAGVDEGLLLWRYMPATGQPEDRSDAAYPVFISHAEEASQLAQAGQPRPRVIRHLAAKEASLQWEPRDWQALPTLHHIVSRLAEIRIQDITACGLVEKLGGGDLSSARRVEVE